MRRKLSFKLYLPLCFLSVFCFGGQTWAGTTEAEIKVVSLSPPRVRIEGRRSDAAAAWSFLNSYATASGLSERIENLILSDERGHEIAVRRTGPGQYLSERPATRFNYELRLDAPRIFQNTAHVSWIAGERGVLLPGDLLPLSTEKVSLRITPPEGWSLSTIEKRNRAGGFDLEDPSRSVFVCGRGLRERRGRAVGFTYIFTIAGQWAFADGEADNAIADILKLHASTIGLKPRDEALIVLLPPPLDAAGTQWAAETRGGTVTLISGYHSSKFAALAQLNGALSHELFHLWVPNALRLTGDYAWFYEGFTNYQALLVGMRRGELTFRDYLNALGRAYDGYLAARGASDVPLVASGNDRWSGNPTLVYHKGMLVAFLSDLSLSFHSGGRQSLTDVYRDLFRTHTNPNAATNGDAAVIASLKKMAGVLPVVEKYIVGPQAIILRDEIAAFGLKIEQGGARTHIGVGEGLTREQRDLLKKFGYNEKLEAESRKRSLRPRGK